MQAKPLAGVASAGPVAVLPVAAVAADVGDTFLDEIAAMLTYSRDNRKALVFHMQGAEVKGVVKEIHRHSLIVSNHEHARILLRFERIDAVEGD
jgi:hypothetical protein